jgi:hypothetical protein
MQRPPSFAGEWRHGWRTEEPGGRDGRKKANYQGLTPHLSHPFLWRIWSRPTGGSAADIPVMMPLTACTARTMV